MNPVDRILSESPSPAAFARGYAKRVSELLAALDADAVERVIGAMLGAREADKKILFIGNGGSAATASHLANDIGIGTRCPEKPFRALSLADSNAVLTCIANDMGYENVFVEQMRIVMQPGDIVVAISASGNSPNIVRAVDFANEHGNTTIGFSGFDGGELKKRAKLCVHIDTEKGEYGPVEDLHLILDHLISGYLMLAVRAKK